MAAAAEIAPVCLQTNRELKGQLDSYSDKFSDFQGTLTKSNEVRERAETGGGWRIQ